MLNQAGALELEEGQIVSLPFFGNEKCVVGLRRSGGMGAVYQLIRCASAPGPWRRSPTPTSATSSQPRQSGSDSTGSSAASIRRMEQLRRRRKAAWEIARDTGIPTSTVNAKYAVAFFRRALRWFERLGIRCRRLLNQSSRAPRRGTKTRRARRILVTEELRPAEKQREETEVGLT